MSTHCPEGLDIEWSPPWAHRPGCPHHRPDIQPPWDRDDPVIRQMEKAWDLRTENAALRADVARKDAALRTISAMCPACEEPSTCSSVIARAALAPAQPPKLTPEDITRLHAEGEECRKALEKRIAPMKQGPFGVPPAPDVARETVRVEIGLLDRMGQRAKDAEARIKELEKHNTELRQDFEAAENRAEAAEKALLAAGVAPP